MTDLPIASHSFCVVEGCTGPSSVLHRVSIWGEEHDVGVCEKHKDSALSEDNVDRSKVEASRESG